MNEWSDDDDEVEQAELSQPNRDMPISSEEEEDYDMEEIRNLTLKKQTNMWNDIVKQEPNKNNIIKKPVQQIKIIQNEPKKYEKRKFNPRLPPPGKNKSNNNFKFNENDFPSL